MNFSTRSRRLLERGNKEDFREHHAKPSTITGGPAERGIVRIAESFGCDRRSIADLLRNECDLPQPAMLSGERSREFRADINGVEAQPRAHAERDDASVLVQRFTGAFGLLESTKRVFER